MATAALLSNILMALIVINYLTTAWLSRRNKHYIWSHRETVPTQFASKITNEEHRKAANYSMTKIGVGYWHNIYSVLILCFWIFFGGLQKLDIFARSFEFSPIVTGLIFFGLFSVVGMILELPFSIYSTFVVEEKYGFNKTTVKTFIIDIFKGLLVGALLGAPLLAGVMAIMEFLGNTWWIWGWAFLTLFQMVMIWAYPRFIAPIFNKFSELEEGEVKDKVNALLAKIGFESKGIFVMDASKRSGHGNAYFTGFGKNKRIVLFDTLLKTLDPNEVEAVLAHELGHFKLKHITKMLLKAFVLSFIGFFILGVAYKTQAFYVGHGVSMPSHYMALVLFSLVAPVYTFFLTPISAWFSRKNEFEADDFAAKHSSAKDLISALVKMYKDNANTLTTDPLYSSFYHSHPPAPIRVNYLETLAEKYEDKKEE